MASLLDAFETAAREGCAFIMLNHGRFALLDEEDLERVEERSPWFASNKGYAVWQGNKLGKAYMHRVVMNAPSGQQVDHRSRDKLDNRRQNLRWCSHGQNVINAEKRRGVTTSRFKGVSWEPRTKRWMVKCNVPGEGRKWKRCKDEVEAAMIYNQWALQSYGEFAVLNKV